MMCLEIAVMKERRDCFAFASLLLMLLILMLLFFPSLIYVPPEGDDIIANGVDSGRILMFFTLLISMLLLPIFALMSWHNHVGLKKGKRYGEEVFTFQAWLSAYAQAVAVVALVAVVVVVLLLTIAWFLVWLEA
jgi:hypothetical protein